MAQLGQKLEHFGRDGLCRRLLIHLNICKRLESELDGTYSSRGGQSAIHVKQADGALDGTVVQVGIDTGGFGSHVCWMNEELQTESQQRNSEGQRYS